MLDLGDATLLPGLIDTHVHLAFDAGLDPVATLAARDDDAVLESMAQAAAAQLRAGVTTVRDLGDRDYLALRLRESRTGLPTIVAAGPPITSAGGHCHFLGGVAERGVRDAVREHAERGVDVIKVMASGGGMTPEPDVQTPQFTPDDLAALVDEAHRHGLPVTAHAHALEAIVDGVAAGVDGLEHCTFIDGERVHAARRRGRGHRAAPDRGGRDARARPGSLPPPRPPASDEDHADLMATLARLIREGAVVVAGTDAGIAPVKPHGVLPHGLLHLAQLGMSPAEALTAGTSTAAQVCGLGDRKGRRAAGLRRRPSGRRRRPAHRPHRAAAAGRRAGGRAPDHDGGRVMRRLLAALVRALAADPSWMWCYGYVPIAPQYWPRADAFEPPGLRERLDDRP